MASENFNKKKKEEHRKVAEEEINRRIILERRDEQNKVFVPRNIEIEKEVTYPSEKNAYQSGINTNNKLIKYHINKMNAFNNKQTYSFKENLENFKNQVPQEYWSFTRPSDFYFSDIIVISYKDGECEVVMGETSLDRIRYPIKTHNTQHPYIYALREMIKIALKNTEYEHSQFEIAVAWHDRLNFESYIKSVAKNLCSNNSQCELEILTQAINLFKKIPIFRVSTDTVGKGYKALEASDNIFLLPDYYTFFKDGLNYIDIDGNNFLNSKWISCRDLNLQDEPFDAKNASAFFIGSLTNSKIVTYQYNTISSDEYIENMASDSDYFNIRRLNAIELSDPELENFVRLKLKSLSNAHPDILDVRFINLCIGTSLNKELCKKLEDAGIKNSEYLDFSDGYAKYKYLISVDGFTAAWCRVPSILHSNSILLKVEGTATEWFYPALKPYVHYIPLKVEENKFLEAMSWLEGNQNQVKTIINNAHDFVEEFLTHDKVVDYTRNILFNYIKLYNEVDHKFVNPHYEQYTLLVPSFDNYSDLWKIFFDNLFMKWPSLGSDNKAKIILTSNYIEFSHPRIENLKLEKDVSWSNGLIEALKNINTKYVILLMDDYIISQPVNENRLNEIIDYMEINNNPYAEIAEDPLIWLNNFETRKNPAPDIENVVIRSIDGMFRGSLQACIWNKAALEKIILPGWSAWQFEEIGNERTKEIEGEFLLVTGEPVFEYINAVNKKVYTNKFLKYVSDNNISMDYDINKIPKIYLKGCKDLESLNNCINNIGSQAEMKIPKIFHRIWFSWDKENPNIPTKYVEFDNIMQSLHPGWEFKYWNEDSILDFITQQYPNFLSTYLSYDNPIKQHDACRYVLMDFYGGVFLQHSIKLQFNLEPLFIGEDVVLSKQSDVSACSRCIANGFLAGIPKHPVWQFLIEQLPLNAHKHVVFATGPQYLAYNVDNYRAFNTSDNTVTELDHQILFPFNWLEKDKSPIKELCIDSHDKCFTLYPDSYAFCPWTASWFVFYE